jgi:transcriptional regulator with XRE-family HTH domain
MTADTEPGQLSAWLRRERQRRGWSQAEMARRLIKAAEANGDHTMPGIDHVLSNLYRWERGTVAPGERYRLFFCHALGMPPPGSSLPRSGTDDSLMAPAVTPGPRAPARAHSASTAGNERARPATGAVASEAQ